MHAKVIAFVAQEVVDLTVVCDLTLKLERGVLPLKRPADVFAVVTNNKQEGRLTVGGEPYL